MIVAGGVVFDTPYPMKNATNASPKMLGEEKVIGDPRAVDCTIVIMVTHLFVSSSMSISTFFFPSENLRLNFR